MQPSRRTLDQVPGRPVPRQMPHCQQPSTSRPVALEAQRHFPYESILSEDPDSEDVLEAFQRFGFDSHNLHLADSNIYKAPDGSFFKCEKINPANSGNSFSLSPLTDLPSSSSKAQQWENGARPSADVRQIQRGFFTATSNGLDWHNGTEAFSESAEADRAFHPLSRQRASSSHNRDRTVCSPHHGTPVHQRQDVCVLEECPNVQPDFLHISHNSYRDIGTVPDARLELQSQEPSVSPTTRQTRRPHYVAGNARSFFLGSDASEPFNNANALQPASRVEQEGYTGSWQRPTVPSSYLSSPFPSDVHISVQHPRKQQQYPAGTLGVGSTTSLPQASSTTRAYPTEFFATGGRSGAQTVATSPSSPGSLDGSRLSDEAAANAPIHVGSDGSTTGSDKASNEGITPGEVLLFDGYVRRSSSFRSSFEPALLKIFRHTITGEIRFFTRIASASGSDTEVFRMRHSEAELVPTYAYDISRGNVLYLRETPATKSGVNPGHSVIYEFSTVEALVDFQGSLLEENVQLDISSLRFVTLITRSDSRRVDFARLQIWHERTQSTDRGDTGSIMTSGTALSGPLRERTSPTSSRLLLFLGRAEEYLSIFVTDDITLEQSSSTSVRLQATKYSGMDYLKSRRAVKCRHVKRTKAAAGIPLSRKNMQPEDEESFEQFKALELEFENEQSLTSFWETWDLLLKRRRRHRASIQGIQNDMSRRVYYGPIATKIL